MDVLEIEALTSAISARFLKFVEDATAPLRRRMSELETALSALPKPLDGHTPTPEELAPVVESAVERAVATLPAPKDGHTPTPEELAPVVESAVERAVATLPAPKDGIGMAGGFVDHDGVLVLTGTDGSIHKQCRVVGIDGKDGAPGAPGLGFDDLDVVHDGERNLTLRFMRGDQIREFSIVLPAVLDRGVWREGEYQKGDAVTWAGSLWIAQQDTSEKPDAGKGWRLAVKRGRDGKDVAAILPRPHA